MEPRQPPTRHLPPEEAQSQDHTYVSVGCVWLGKKHFYKLPPLTLTLLTCLLCCDINRI